MDTPFPSKIRDKIVASGLADAHHILPESGWVSFDIHHLNDDAAVIDLLQRSYAIAVQQQACRR